MVPLDPTRRKHFEPDALGEDLLVPIFRKGKLLYRVPDSNRVRERVQEQLAMLHSGIKRFANPHQYPAGLELSLHDLKTQLIFEARGERPDRSSQPSGT